MARLVPYLLFPSNLAILEPPRTMDNYSYLLRNLSAIIAPTRHTISETLNAIDHIANALRLELRVSSQTCLLTFRHCPTTYRIYQMSPTLPLSVSHAPHASSASDPHKLA